VSISSTFLEQLLLAQIPKEPKRLTWQLDFWDLHSQKLLVKCCWTIPHSKSSLRNLWDLFAIYTILTLFYNIENDHIITILKKLTFPGINPTTLNAILSGQARLTNCGQFHQHHWHHFWLPQYFVKISYLVKKLKLK